MKVDITKNHNMKHTKCLIIGSGPAGYTAGIYAARAAMEPVIIAGWQKGGQLMITTDVENYPGYENIVQGPWMMDQMEKQVKNVGAEVIEDAIKSVDFSKKPFVIETDLGVTWTADTVVISTGAQAKWLGIPSEKEYQGFGVSGCATCDGSFFKNKIVAVVGGGDTAAEEALFLTNHAAKVYMIHRRDQLRASCTLAERIKKNEKIEILWNQEIHEILGKKEPHKHVTGITLKDTQTNELKTLELNGVFIAIGHSPTTQIFKGQLDMDEQGYILASPGTTVTSVPGVFAAGDVQDKVYRQAITAAAHGCMAALDAERYLQEG